MSKKISWKKLLPIGFLVGLVAVVFWKVVLLRRIFMFGDIEHFFYPGGIFYAQQLKQGSISLWTSYLGFGFPIHAESQIGFFYPLNLALFYLLPSSIVLSCSIFFHIFLAGLFAFLYARVIGLGKVASLLCGTIFMLSGFFMGHIIHPSMLCACIWLPLAFLFIELYFKERDFLYITFTGVVVGLQLLSGNPQISLYSLSGILLYFTYKIFLDLKTRKTFKGVLPLFLNLALTILIGAGLASVQLLPTYELAKLSVRSGGTGVSIAESFAFPVQNFVLFIFPFFFGKWNNYWGASTFWETSCYVGMMSLFLVLAAFIKKRGEHTHFFIGLLFLSLLLALGTLTPFYRILRFLPFFNYFGAPGRFLYLSTFSIAVLAAIGLEHLANEINENGKQIARKVLKVFCPVIFLIGFLTIIAQFILIPQKGYFISLGKRYVRHFVYGRSYHTNGLPYYYEKIERMYSSFVRTMSLSNPHILLPLTLLLLAVCWLYLWQRGKFNARIFKGGVLCFIVLDLAFFAYMSSAPLLREPKEVLSAPSHIEFLKGMEQGGRKLTIPSHDPSNVDLIYQQSSADLYTPLCTSRYTSFMRVLMDSHNSSMGDDFELGSEFTKIAGLSNIKYVLSPLYLEDSQLKLIYDKEINIYENKEVLPRAYIVSKAKIARDGDEALRLLKSSEFDPRDCVILEESPRLKSSEMSASFNHWQAKIVNYSNEEVTIEVNSKNDGFLVLSDTFYPGWKVFVDGKEAKIYRANYLFRAVELNKGEHVVRFEFEPQSYKLGLIITLSTLIILLMTVSYLLVKRYYLKNDV